MKNYTTRVLFLLSLTYSISFSSMINLDNNTKNLISNRYGGDALERIKSLNQFVEKIDSNTSLVVKLNLINNFFNQFTYLRDKNHWKKDDYWANLIEFVATGAGDSEDFAMAKYFVLTKLGLPKEQFELLYDKNIYKFTKQEDKEHIVLSYKHTSQSKVIVLDCVSKKLKVIDNRSDYKELEKPKSFIEDHLNTMLDFR